MRTILILLALCCTIRAGESGPWPLEIARPGGVVTIYQPQPERLAGNRLTARAAASWLKTGEDEAQRVFAAIWLEVVLDIDRESDVASTRSIHITKVVTPKGEVKQDGDTGARAAVEAAILAQGLQMDLDRLVATIEEVNGGATGFSDDAPRILIRTAPAILIPRDGEVRWQKTDNGIERDVSTPAFLAKAEGVLWLRIDAGWLKAVDPAGPWSFADEQPSTVIAAAKALGVETGSMRAANAVPPEVLFASGAAELLCFDGKPEFEPLTPDGALLVATNTEDDVVVEVASGRHFILCSGRWFAGSGLAEDVAWKMVPGDQLPKAFASIPADGERAHLRAHVAGTSEAVEAAALAQVPQTARVPRSNTITVTFSGEPVWVDIPDLGVAWAKNSADAVFKLAGPYFYCCRDGVWYEAEAVTGPWRVAASKPEALDRLPPSCPWYTCNAVEIYDCDHDYVWVGYTPAYYGWYVYGGCPVYGTGWWYSGYWVGHPVYYPVTYGVRVRYNPWTGNWAVGIGVSGPGWAVGGIRVGGWWGSSGIVIGGGGAVVRPGPGQPGTRPVRPTPYDRVPGATRPQLQQAADRLRGQQPSTRPAGPAVDRAGNITRPGSSGGLEERNDRNWTPKAGTKPVALPPQAPPRPAERPETRPAPIQRQEPARVEDMRSRGETRIQQRSSPPPRPTSRPASGGGRGGGGRR